MLVVSALVIGVSGTMVNLHASEAGMSYYFAAQTGWVFMVWLVLGIQFRLTARACLIITLTLYDGCSFRGPAD